MPNIYDPNLTQDDATAARLAAVREQVGALCRRHGREPGSVRVLAVSKTKPPAAVAAAYAAQQRDFGENFLQDAATKLDCVPADACWHFIGAMQSNKTRTISERFSWVHTIDRERIARRLSDQRPDGAEPLCVCIQVNIDDEASKAGVSATDALPLAHAVAALPRLRLRGFMGIPKPASTLGEQRAPFAELRELLERAQGEGLALDTLSMGMSNDMEAAIAEGATIVRIGTAIFGARDRPWAQQ